MIMTEQPLKRYDLEWVGSGFHGENKLVPSLSGDWVKFDAAAAQIDALNLEITELRRKLGEDSKA